MRRLLLAFALPLVACGGKPADNASNDMQLLGNDTHPAATTAAGPTPPEVAEGKSLLEQKKREAARDVLAKAVQKYPKDPEASYYLALAYDELGDKQAAETYYKTTLALAPRQPDAATNLSAIELDQGNVDDAIALCRDALTAHADVPQLHFNLARGLASPEKPGGAPRDADGATREFQAAIKLAADNADFHTTYGSYLGVLGKADAARAELSTALADAKDDPDVLASIALAYAGLKDAKQCVVVFDRSIAAADVPSSRVGRARCKMASGDMGGAETDLRAAINTNANDGAAYYWLGIFLAGKGDLRGAVKALEDCQRVDPDGPYAKQAQAKAQVLRSKIK